jgi:hypothetical protein
VPPFIVSGEDGNMDATSAPLWLPKRRRANLLAFISQHSYVVSNITLINGDHEAEYTAEGWREKSMKFESFD